MFQEELIVSNVSSSNAGEVSHGLIVGNLNLLFSQDHQTQHLSNDDVMDWDRTEGKALGDFRVALADALEAVLPGIGNDSEGGAANNQADNQSILIPDISSRRLDTEHKCDICDSIFQNAHLLKKHKSVHDNNHTCQRPVCGSENFEPNNINLHNMTHTGKQTFRCDFCGKDFSRKYNLYIHQKTHGNGDIYRCDKCNKHFATNTMLVKHKSLHDNERLYLCTMCDSRFTSITKCRMHMETHQDTRPYKCNKCGKSFKTETTLYHHRNVHKNSKDIHCCYCDASYKSQNSLRIHCNNKHPGLPWKKKSTNADDGAVVNGLPPVIDQPSTSATDSAGWPFDQSNKSDADNLHDPAFDLIASSQADKQSSLTAAHSFSHPGTEYKCDIYDALFESDDRMRKHELINDSEKLHQGSVYDLTSTEADGIDRHDIINTDQQSFKCDICNACFNSQRSFDRHKKKAHNAKNLYQCAVCRQRFRTNAGLLRHKKFHDPARHYKCSSCSSRFNDLHICRKHESIIHDNERSYNCDKSDKKFKAHVMLIQHQTVHDIIDPVDTIKNCEFSCGMRPQSMRILTDYKKDKHPEQPRGTRSINADNGVVISQSSPVIDRSSTSGTCRNDLTAEERFNQLPDKPDEISPGDGESEVPDRSCIESASDTVVDVDKTHKHKKKEITEGSAGKRQHEMSGPLEKQTTNGGVVISQLPPVTDQPSTSTTDIDLMTGEDLDNVLDACLSDLCSADQPYDRLHKSCPDHSYNSAIDSYTDKTNHHDKKEVTVNSLEGCQYGISGPLAEQAADGCSVANQSRPVINNSPSEDVFDEMLYNYARKLFDNNNWLPDESG